jgi:hypothetical protein
VVGRSAARLPLAARSKPAHEVLFLAPRARRPNVLGQRDQLAELIRKDIPMPGKRVQFDEETWNALDLLARDRMQDFQELADEAFSDLLRKHGRPTDLKTALRQSVGTAEKSAVINPDFQKRGPRRRPDVSD